ncbi:MAG: hypothetical protein HN580_28965 [Deltaproteobacteria bacterium]|jgi:hypothetical protein|nr:hypothetical protein [Deltaproteobacteria bacterium]MBT4992388.1 hypothetical protein [Candidatus Neomarinimicrobiota bacterium]MBT4263105.1 hypothetical protein [Deltaproteobacteria bacterium]MBT4643456.1 hypothetical protein [Deltaproteobacteria bacterium]MBT6501677.1 hypothetical protein [Deltaproteobacteria bacterium]
MAEYGEWNRKGASLSDKTAKKEYGIDLEFIEKGIRSGKLDYRQGNMWGNPYIKVLRGQLEQLIVEELGIDQLTKEKNKTELRKVKSEIRKLKKQLDELQFRKLELEKILE